LSRKVVTDLIFWWIIKVSVSFTNCYSHIGQSGADGYDINRYK